MMQDVVKAIIFDLGNVLIDFDHSIAAKKIAKLSDKRIEEIFGLFFDSGITVQFERGEISPGDFFRRVRQILNITISYEEFLPIWNGIFFFSRKNEEVYNLARSLRNRYKLAVLSNINVLHYEYIKKNFNVLGIFDAVFASYELGLVKPDYYIYEKTIKSLETAPQNVFYTDDRPELVRGASRLGIRSFVFKGVQQLKEDMACSGIKINCA